jgi:hypothetical protein
MACPRPETCRAGRRWGAARRFLVAVAPMALAAEVAPVVVLAASVCWHSKHLVRLRIARH